MGNMIQEGDLLRRHFEGLYNQGGAVSLLEYRGLSEKEIEERRGTSFEEALKFFAKDSVENYPIVEEFGVRRKKWSKSFAANNEWYTYPDPITLEPFVARLVVALNLAGSRTIFSCDSWHKDPREGCRDFVIKTFDPGSLAWIKVMMDAYVKDTSVGYCYEAPNVLYVPLLLCGDEEKLAMYDRINQDAAVIAANYRYLHRKKRELVDRVKGMQKNTLDLAGLEQMILEHVTL